MAIYKDVKHIILDYSANTHKNDFATIDRILGELQEIREGHNEVTIKAQLFKRAGKNIVCKKRAFEYLYNKAIGIGFKCTASVFDKESLLFLVKNFDIDFVKFSCNRMQNDLVEFVPSKVKIFQSVSPDRISIDLVGEDTGRVYMLCVPSYPANLGDYPIGYSIISDHVVGLSLWNRDTPIIWEKHLMAEDSTGLDAGPFAITPKQLTGII